MLESVQDDRVVIRAITPVYASTRSLGQVRKVIFET